MSMQVKRTYKLKWCKDKDGFLRKSAHEKESNWKGIASGAWSYPAFNIHLR